MPFRFTGQLPDSFLRCRRNRHAGFPQHWTEMHKTFVQRPDIFIKIKFDGALKERHAGFDYSSRVDVQDIHGISRQS